MIGDKVNSKPKHAKAARQIFEIVGDELAGRRSTFTIAGESGSGKSEIAYELAQLLEHANIKTLIFQQDDYFFYPPRTNHNRRVQDIAWVGTKEVNLSLLDEHLDMFSNSATQVLEKPLVIFEEDRIISEKTDLSPFAALIAEGTYTTLLKHAQHRVFIDRDYSDTRADRKERAREVIDEFSEKIMEIEHNIISKHKDLATLTVHPNFTVTKVTP